MEWHLCRKPIIGQTEVLTLLHRRVGTSGSKCRIARIFFGLIHWCIWELQMHSLAPMTDIEMNERMGKLIFWIWSGLFFNRWCFLQAVDFQTTQSTISTWLPHKWCFSTKIWFQMNCRNNFGFIGLNHGHFCSVSSNSWMKLDGSWKDESYICQLNSNPLNGKADRIS